MGPTETSCPIFEVEDNVEAWESILIRAIPEINLQYFDTNPRFKDLEKVSLLSLVDYMGIYEEGDWWAVSIVKVITTNDRLKYIFLPLVAQIADLKSPNENFFLPGIQNTIFRLQTNSQSYGRRNWKINDAFSDVGFCVKLINLFLPWEKIPENHVNAYTNMRESGIGKFVFHSPLNFQLEWDIKKGVLVELTETGDISLKYGNSYQLLIYKVLPFANTISALEKHTNFLGHITYSGVQQPELIVGTLLEIR